MEASTSASAAAAGAWQADLPFLELFLGFTCLVTLFHLWLDVRQLRVLRAPKPPPVLAEHFDTATYSATQSYSLDKWWFSLYHGLYSFLETVAVLVYRVLPWVWVKAGLLLQSLPGPVTSRVQPEIAQTVIFVLILLGSNVVMDLPWSLYRTFVIEQRHGFNKQTPSLFFTDIAKSVALGLVLIPPVVAGVTYILQVGGQYLALYLWAFMLVLSLTFMSLYPTIAALFNKFEPLQEGSLRTSIEQLAGTLKFPLKKLFKVDGSKRSAHSNAYMYGFWRNKRIVLYDTLLSQCSEAQVVAVLAHELGHWKLRHTPVLFCVGQLVMLLNFLLFTYIRTSPNLFESFGFEGLGRPAFISLVLYQFISSPVDELVHYAQNMVSRTFEFQADSFAISQGLGADLRMALLKLEEENKSAMNVDPLYSAYHYSHPPLAERLRAIDRGLKKAI